MSGEGSINNGKVLGGAAKELRDRILTSLEKQNLPTLPDVFAKLMRLASDEQVSLHKLAEVTRLDAALVSRVLKHANSAYYGGGVPVTRVEDAVLRIGLRETRNLIFSLSIIAAMPRQGRLNFAQFWMHNLSVGFAVPIVERMSPRIGKPSPEGFVAGLLHDLGILILDHYARQHYDLVLTAPNAHRELWEIEREYLGLDHGEVGSLLLLRWNLPRSMVQAVKNHHNPMIVPPGQAAIVKAVHVANYACNVENIRNGLQPYPDHFIEDAWSDLGLSVEQVPALIAEVHAQTEAAKRVLEVAL